MFRIVTAFEDEHAVLLKLEGVVHDSDVPGWASALEKLKHAQQSRVILDFCELNYISISAIEVLLSLLTPACSLLNSPVGVKNILYARGMSDRILE